MLYQAYQAQTDMLVPVRAAAGLGRTALELLPDSFSSNIFVRNLSATYELIDRFHLTHERPPFAIASVRVGGLDIAVTEHVAHRTPFGTLLHFAKDTAVPQPRVLVVAPLSGHFSTLLRATVRTLLPEHDVYLTDWHNARDIPVCDGRFGFDEYIEHLITFLGVLGGGTHLVAVCQPSVAALVATAVMAEAGDPAVPRTMTLMAGPIDTRINPTAVDELATEHPIEWFERWFIDTVPLRYPGASRRVYPGFLQVAAFMSMNIERHVDAHRALYFDIVNREWDNAKRTTDFYDEYLAVLDMTAEFYLETVRIVFQEHRLPRGTLEYQGRRVDPRAIRRTALLTVEGERDDICAVGQTMAAHDLCSGIAPSRKRHHLQSGVGHYGVFSGRRWEAQIYPILRNLILANE